MKWIHLCREAPANPNAAPAAGQPPGAAAGPWSINILEIERHRRDLVVHTTIGADSKGQFTRVPLTDLAAKAKARGDDVLAAINGDFDMADPYLGIPIGLAISHGSMWSAGGPPRPALMISASGFPVIGVPKNLMELRAGGKHWPIDSFNKPMGFSKTRNLRIYTRAFHTEVRATEPFGAAVITNLDPGLPLPAVGGAWGTVTEIRAPAKEQVIPEDSVLVAEPLEKDGRARVLSNFKVGKRVLLRLHTATGQRNNILDAAGGLPLLVSQGKVSIMGEGEPGDYLRARHPRTAVCYNENETIFAVVDGRQAKLSVGITLEELAAFMVSLGCTEAMNTDGGGSSEMAVALPAFASRPSAIQGNPESGLTIVNSPSDGHERGRPNAWLVIRKR